MQFFEYIDIMQKPYDIFETDNVHSPLHWHYYSEILYLKQGAVTLTCNERKFVLRQGDLCYIYPLQLHSVSAADAAEVQYIVLKFDMATLHIPAAYLEAFYTNFVYRSAKRDFCRILHEREDLAISERMQKILSEYTERKAFYPLQIQADVTALLILLARETGTENPDAERHAEHDFSFYHILEYIDRHSGEKLEVQALAEHCHMSYSYFAKRFREHYGRSCKEYITYIRLKKAQELLLHTTYDLNYIAAETGFFDCSHLIHAYQKWRGMTPKQERQRFSPEK